ncbi:hypothetical protein CO611_09150 [Lysobacteraceae bacterium NML03-0222]|nr:hypothetical protein CO611_09150 [Xanthomonadaceae bacterium NML03-0222]
MGFQLGWYIVRTDHEGRRFARHYISPNQYDATCVVEPNGQQILLWYTPDPAQYQSEPVSPDWVFTPDADKGDWWDNPAHSRLEGALLPGNYSRENRKASARELCQRAETVDVSISDGLQCIKEINVGIFFDGTNNNMTRDKPKSHSNIVSLYDSHPDDRVDNFRYYIPGVGTKFEQIGEMTESDNGKAMGKGGEARIHWAMLEVLNAVSAASLGYDLLTQDEMKTLVTSYRGLKNLWRLGDGKMQHVFAGLKARLLQAVAEQRPRVVRVNLSVFGFSRGAAEARVFCNWLERATSWQLGYAEVKLRFLGLFDTVASVGLADSSPVGNGLMDWADGNLGVLGAARSVHYVAAHEIRRSFPLSTARDRRGRGVAGVSEYIYPGAHSDIGGGYGPGEQGKSRDGRSHLLSQIALSDMYFQALAAGSTLRSRERLPDEVKTDFSVSTELDRAFSSYLDWTWMDERGEDVAQRKQQHVETTLQQHMQQYWRWRASKGSDAEFMQMSSYRHANAQDRIDLWEAELDWRADIAAAQNARKYARYDKDGNYRGETEVQRDLLRVVEGALDVPSGVDTFFDQYVHDSHAGFWLLGPLTEWDKQVFTNEIIARQENYETLMELVESESTRLTWQDRNELRRYAYQYKLNNFERRVLEASRNKQPFPVMTDADAADLRRGAAGVVVRYVLGTATRREANGHGQYRRVFSKS